MQTIHPVGPATKATLGGAAVAFGLSVLLYLTGDHSVQSHEAVYMAGGAFALAGVGAVGRYAQSIYKKQPVIAPEALEKLLEDVIRDAEGATKAAAGKPQETDPTVLATVAAE